MAIWSRQVNDYGGKNRLDIMVGRFRKFRAHYRTRCAAGSDPLLHQTKKLIGLARRRSELRLVKVSLRARAHA